MTASAFLRGTILTIALATELIAQNATPAATDEERRQAFAAVVPQLEQLAQTCERKKLLRERDRVYAQILHFDQDHAAARKALKFKRGTDGRWQQEPGYQEPKDASDKELAAFAKDRQTAIASCREPFEKLFAKAAPGSEQRTLLAEDLVVLDPDDAAAREVLGEVKDGKQWVLKETLTARARRAELHGFAREALEAAAEPTEAQPSALESALAVNWTKIVQEPGVRVLGTGEPEEILLVARANQAAAAFFHSVFQVEAKFWPSYTLYVLANEGERESLVARHPAPSEQQRKYLLSVNSGGFPGTSQWGHWGPDQARRLDSSARSTLNCFLSEAFGIKLAHGWVWEGLGLYLTRELVGTRLTSFAGTMPAEQASLHEKLLRSDTSWMNEAYQLLRSNKNPPLTTVLSEDVSAMGPADALVAYALAAYLLEAHAEQVAPMLTRVGKAEPSAAVLTSALGMPLEQIEARLVRWLGERH